jgi:hypothetical protein
MIRDRVAGTRVDYQDGTVRLDGRVEIPGEVFLSNRALEGDDDPASRTETISHIKKRRA